MLLPGPWKADAASLTVVSLSLAGRLLPSDCLPATLPVGYNHAPAPAGAVLEAAMAGDVPALHAALEAGGSTEEACEVRGWGGGVGADCTIKMRVPLLQDGSTPSWWAAGCGYLEALRTLLAAGANPAAADTVRENEGKCLPAPWQAASHWRGWGGNGVVASLPLR